MESSTNCIASTMTAPFLKHSGVHLKFPPHLAMYDFSRDIPWNQFQDNC